MPLAYEKSESPNSSVWDKLKFESSRYITVSLSCLGWIKEVGNKKKSQRGNARYKGRKIVNKGKKMADRKEGAAAPNQRQGQNQQQNQEAAGQ